MKKLYNLLLLTCMPLWSLAHGYWLELRGVGRLNEPVTVQLCHGEIDNNSVRHRETGPDLAEMSHFTIYVVTPTGERLDLSLQPRADCWEATFIPTTTGAYQILGKNEELPVVDRSGRDAPSVRAIQYVCAVYGVGVVESVITPRQFLDITTVRTGKIVTIHTFKALKPVAVNTKLRIFNPENWEKTPATDAQGTATFTPTMPGLYIIRQDWIDPTPGLYKGVSYQSVRYRCDYSLRIE